MFLSLRKIAPLGPGLLLAAAVAGLAMLVQTAERALFGQAWIEGLVLAILIGTAVRSLWGVSQRHRPGIDFATRGLLETAIVLLGASVSVETLARVGWEMVAGVAGIVLLALGGGYLIGRALGLSAKLALLVGCGNAICGNSAIVAAASVIRADPRDIAASVAFTAALGILVVLFLPLMYFWGGVSETQYGILAGMTVYAVPQVLAAAAPVGPLSVQVGTTIKLVRVLMLGPVLLLLALVASRGDARLPLGKLVPWFIVGFFALMAARAAGLVPQAAAETMARLSNMLTIVAMAGLGLGVDIRTLAHASGRVVLAGVLSLALIGLASWVLIGWLRLA